MLSVWKVQSKNIRRYRKQISYCLKSMRLLFVLWRTMFWNDTVVTIAHYKSATEQCTLQVVDFMSREFYHNKECGINVRLSFNPFNSRPSRYQHPLRGFPQVGRRARPQWGCCADFVKWAKAAPLGAFQKAGFNDQSLPCALSSAGPAAVTQISSPQGPGKSRTVERVPSEQGCDTGAEGARADVSFLTRILGQFVRNCVDQTLGVRTNWVLHLILRVIAKRISKIQALLHKCLAMLVQYIGCLARYVLLCHFVEESTSNECGKKHPLDCVWAHLSYPLLLTFFLNLGPTRVPIDIE